MDRAEGETWVDRVAGVNSDGQVVIMKTMLFDPQQWFTAEGMTAETVCNGAERAFGNGQTVQESDGMTFTTNQFGQREEY